MPFWPKKRIKTVNQDLLLKLGTELEEKSSRSEGTGHVFIHPDNARLIFKREHVKELLGALSWYDEDYRTVLWQNMCLIMCILVSMRWPEWDQFRDLFFFPGEGLKSPRYTDSDLPIKKEAFPEKASVTFLKQFHEHQYRFVPITIKEGSHLEYSTDRRLPVLKREPLRDAEGAQGIVEKVFIEKNFLYYANDASNHSVSHLSLVDWIIN